MLKKLGIVKTETKGYKVFNKYIEPDFLNNTMEPCEYVDYCWKRYNNSDLNAGNALNGSVFELIISSLFVKERILPLYLQAKVAFVPNVNFDAILYDKGTGPIGISMKTSLRERYKQADLEAIALKYVHRKAENYLLTLDPDEAENLSNKISNGDLLGINKAILVTDHSFDDFIGSLKARSFIAPGKIDIIAATSVVTSEIVERNTR